MKKCDKCDTENFNTSKYCSGCGYELPQPIEKDEIAQNVNSQLPPRGIGRGINVRAIIGAVVGILICFGLQQLLFKKPSYDKVMVEAMNMINKACPMMADAETRLDNTTVIPPKTFQYNYTLVNIESGSIDTLEVKKIMEPIVLNFVKTNPQMKMLRDNNLTLNYFYKDKNGVYLFQIPVTPNQYK